jgi:hypothetical protein
MDIAGGGVAVKCAGTAPHTHTHTHTQGNSVQCSSPHLSLHSYHVSVLFRVTCVNISKSTHVQEPNYYYYCVSLLFH